MSRVEFGGKWFLTARSIFGSFLTILVMSPFRTPHVGKGKKIERRNSSPRITNVFKELLRRGRNAQET